MGNYKGGYILIDLENIHMASGDEYTIKGITKRCQDATKYGKPIILTNMYLENGDDVISNGAFTSLCDKRDGSFSITFLWNGTTCTLYIENDSVLFEI